MKTASRRALALAIIGTEAYRMTPWDHFSDHLSHSEVAKLKIEMEAVGAELRTQAGVRNNESWIEFAARIE